MLAAFVFLITFINGFAIKIEKPSDGRNFY